MKRGYETTDAATYQLLLQRAKENRANPTEAESLLWSFISGRKLGAHFRRQHPIFGYIPDFVCLNFRLIIEIDGGYHLESEQIIKDEERTAYLSSIGYTVLRFTNDEVMSNIEEVLDRIGDAIDEQMTHLLTSPSSSDKTNQTPQLPSSDKTIQTRQFPSSDKTIQAPSLREGWGGFSALRVGFGFDVHRLVSGRDLWMGGIKIDHCLGLLGHSDADVLIHAICDALLGAANMRDIGYHFPDTSADTLDIDSKILLCKTVDLIATKGYAVGNIDATICAERPKMNPHIPAMKACLAEVIGTDEDNISIKATTTERLGFTGREEGISAYATVLIAKVEG